MNQRITIREILNNSDIKTHWENGRLVDIECKYIKDGEIVEEFHIYPETEDYLGLQDMNANRLLTKGEIQGKNVEIETNKSQKGGASE